MILGAYNKVFWKNGVLPLDYILGWVWLQGRIQILKTVEGRGGGWFQNTNLGVDQWISSANI